MMSPSSSATCAFIAIALVLHSSDQHLDVKNGCTHLIHVNDAFSQIFGGRR
jgi:hypothetical protein